MHWSVYAALPSGNGVAAHRQTAAIFQTKLKGKILVVILAAFFRKPLRQRDHAAGSRVHWQAEMPASTVAARFPACQ
jgi:hypothetical protein